MSKLFDYRHRFIIGEQIHDYTIEAKIGEGRFGIVYLAKNNSDHKVIVKQLKREMLLKQPEKAKFEPSILKELSVLNDSRFPQYIDSFNVKYRKGYILEYKEGNTFEELIYKQNHRFNKSQIYDITLQLLSILETLETHHIIHKDIRVSNVILMDNFKIALIDFGLARYIDNKRYKKDLDYWYLADFLIHLHYTNYHQKSIIDKPWYEQLDLLEEELILLKRLMQIDSNIYKPFTSIEEIKSIVMTLLNH